VDLKVPLPLRSPLTRFSDYSSVLISYFPLLTSACRCESILLFVKLDNFLSMRRLFEILHMSMLEILLQHTKILGTFLATLLTLLLESMSTSTNGTVVGLNEATVLSSLGKSGNGAYLLNSNLWCIANGGNLRVLTTVISQSTAHYSVCADRCILGLSTYRVGQGPSGISTGKNDSSRSRRIARHHVDASPSSQCIASRHHCHFVMGGRQHL